MNFLEFEPIYIFYTIVLTPSSVTFYLQNVLFLIVHSYPANKESKIMDLVAAWLIQFWLAETKWPTLCIMWMEGVVFWFKFDLSSFARILLTML